MSYAKKRYITYAVITLFTLILPFITINGNHLLLLSFTQMKFHFIGFSFNMNELFVMPFLLMILFIGIFAITTMGGRIWCGWACPQTIFRVIYRDLIESTLLDLRRIKNKQKEINYNSIAVRVKKYISLTLWAILCLVIASNFMWYFVPPEEFFVSILDPMNHVILVMFVISIAVFLFYDIVFMKENFCTYVCPYSRIQSTLYDDNTKQVIYNHNRGGHIYNSGEKSIFKMKQWEANEECTTCESCVKICPTNIDIRKGHQVECINCLECVDACTTVMGKLGKKSLIEWGSTNRVLKEKFISFFNMKNITYLASIALCIILAGVTMSKKEPFLININKTTQLYKIEGKKVRNNYLVTLHNRGDQTQTYALQLANKDFAIKRFKKVTLKPDQRVKTVLIVEATKRQFISDVKDTPLRLQLNAFTKEQPNEIITKELSFVYPRNDAFVE